MKIAIVFLVSLLVFFAFVRYLERHSIYFPTSDIPVTPDALGIPFDDVYFLTQDHVKLNGWLLKSPRAKATLLFFHGNGGNNSHRLEKLEMFYQLGLNVFIVDYRGYGKSEGRPSEQGLYRDALAAYDYLVSRQDIPRGTIIGYGASLGGVVAIDLATKRNLSCLIVDSSIPSAAEMSRIVYPFIPTFFLSTKFDSLSKVRTLSIPKLFIHSVNDEIVPFELGKRLFNAAAAPKELLEITGGHNTSHIDSRKKYLERFRSFLQAQELLY